MIYHCPACNTPIKLGDRGYHEGVCPECDQPINVWTETIPIPANDSEPEEERPRRRREEDDEEDRPRKRRKKKRSRGGGGCPYCGSTEPPARGSRISQGGWITFAVLLLLCWPLCFLGLFIKEDYPVCYDCGRGLG